MAQFQLRTSERTALKRCPQKWYWSHVDGLDPFRSANPLWFGAAVHDGLAGWYLEGTKRGAHPAETFDASLEGDRSFLVTNEEEEKEYEDARTLGVDMLEHYVEYYGKDQHLHFIATEQPFQVWIPSPDGKKRRWLRYVGTFDGVYRDLDTEEIWLIEHKSAASIDPGHLPLDDQAGTYLAVANSKLRSQKVLGPKEEIAGIMYNFLRKAMRDTRPINADGWRTNTPQKKHYVAALKELDVHSITAKDSDKAVPVEKAKIEDLEVACNFAQIQVLGEPSKQQPPLHFERIPIYRSRAERKYMIQRIQAEATYAEKWRAGDPSYPLFKTPVAAGPQACKHSCQFFRMCQLHEQGDQAWKEYRDTMYKVRDPYAEHDRKGA